LRRPVELTAKALRSTTGRIRLLLAGRSFFPDIHACKRGMGEVMLQALNDVFMGFGPKSDIFRMGSFFVGGVFFFFRCRRVSTTGAEARGLGPFAALLANVSGFFSFSFFVCSPTIWGRSKS